MTGELTAGEVAARLGVKVGMVRRYALALERVTGLSLAVDPVRGRLYPPATVELLEAARAHLLAHPGQSVEGALRAVTGQGDGAVMPPARVPGTVGPEDLRAALEGALGQVTEPLLARLDNQQHELAALRSEVAALGAELRAARATVERLEVMTRAALPAPAQQAAPSGVLGLLARLMGLQRVK